MGDNFRIMFNNKADIAEEVEENIRKKVRTLPDEKRKIFYLLCEHQLKDPDTYAVLNYLLITGAHHFYLRKWLRGFINIALLTIAIILMFLGNYFPAIIIVIVLTIVELYELFKSQDTVRSYNNNVMENIYQKVTNTPLKIADAIVNKFTVTNNKLLNSN